MQKREGRVRQFTRRKGFGKVCIFRERIVLLDKRIVINSISRDVDVAIVTHFSPVK